MSLSRFVLLASPHGWDDLPIQGTRAQAASILASWTALWHPALIALAGSTPQCLATHEVPATPTGWLVTVPLGARTPDELVQRISQGGGLVIRHGSDLDSVLAEIREFVKRSCPPDTPWDVDPADADEFFALSLGVLHVQVMTRRLRYDAPSTGGGFDEAVVAAAQRLVRPPSGQPQPESARALLAGAIDRLTQWRTHYYPTTPQLVDLTCLTSVAGDVRRHCGSLTRQLQRPHAQNLILDGATLERLAQVCPDVVAQMREQAAQGALTMVGGMEWELPAEVVSVRSLVGQVARGRDVFANYLGSPPDIFGRYRFGLGPIWPAILRDAGFSAALHATFDGGTYPESAHDAVSWKGWGDQSITALARWPLDASQPEGLLALGQSLADSLDNSGRAAVVLAHWPGATSRWFDLLVRLAEAGPVVGRFVTLDEWRRGVGTLGHHNTWSGDRYQAPRPDGASGPQDESSTQAAAPDGQLDPARGVAYWQRTAWAAQREGLAAMRALLPRRVPETFDAAAGTETSGDGCDGDSLIAPDHAAAASGDANLTGDLAADIEASADSLAAAIARSAPSSSAGSASAGESGAIVLMNGLSFARRQFVLLDGPSLPVVAPPVYAADWIDGRAGAVIDVPPLGFAVVRPTERALPRPLRRSQPAIVDDLTLANEFVEVAIDPRSGGIQAIRRATQRGVVASQRLAVRGPASRSAPTPHAFPGSSSDAFAYGEMRTTRIATTRNSSLVGEISSAGQLMFDDQLVADFSQHVRLVRGRRVVELEVELRCQTPLVAGREICSRLAWSDPGAKIRRGLNETAEPTTRRSFQSPLFVEVAVDDGQLTLFPCGLADHRRVAGRFLDTLLLGAPTTHARWKLAIGVDVRYPVTAAYDLLSPAPTAALATADGPAHGWMFHFDCRNVIALGWQVQHRESRAVIEILLKEIEQRPADLTIATSHPVAAARLVDAAGSAIGGAVECQTRGARLRLAAGGLARVEIALETEAPS